MMDADEDDSVEVIVNLRCAGMKTIELLMEAMMA